MITRTLTSRDLVVPGQSRIVGNRMIEFLPVVGDLDPLVVDRLLVVRVSLSRFLVVRRASSHALGPVIGHPASLLDGRGQ